MTVDAAFAALMARTDPTVVIVTTVVAEELSGCLVGFHGQASIDPPRYAIWLSKANHTFRLGEGATIFAVHWVPADRHDLAELFGGTTGDEVDKLARCSWQAGPDGVPLLDDCPDRFVGRRWAWDESGGDHVCVVLEPIAAVVSDERPWLTRAQVSDVDAGHAADERPPPT